MGELNLNDVLVSPLKRISTTGGDVLHAFKYFDAGFKGFGEVYFSWIEQGAIKAWKYHQRMTLNLVVPIGEVSLVFHLTKQKNIFRTENIGEERYVRLTVPPRIWLGFQGIASGRSLLMNLADIEHDPDEVEHCDFNVLPYDWGN